MIHQMRVPVIGLITSESMIRMTPQEMSAEVACLCKQGLVALKSETGLVAFSPGRKTSPHFACSPCINFMPCGGMFYGHPDPEKKISYSIPVAAIIP